MRPTPITRLLALSLLLAMALTGLPAAAQDEGLADGPSLEEEAGAADIDAGEDPDTDDADTDDADTDGPRERPNRGGAHLATGEVTGHLAPAVSAAGQEVAVHAVAQIDEGSGGRPDGAGPPEHAGRPDHAGQSADSADEHEETVADDATETQDPVPAGEAAFAQNAGEESSEEDRDEDGDDEAWRCVPQATTSFAQDDPAVEHPDEGPAPCDVTFTVDYGDGSAVETMRPTKTRGRDGTRRAIGRHVFEADGEYIVTVTAVPLEGEPSTFELVAQVGAGTARLEGDSRIETAIRISHDTFPDDGSAQAVMIARADQFADALAASTLAFVQQGPILLTSSDQVPAGVLDEIDRVLADGGTVFLMGGEAALSMDVETALDDLGHTAVRLAGDDRIATALVIAQHLLDGGLVPAELVVASAGDFPDALAGAAYAAANDALVLLTGGDVLDVRVAALIDGLDDIPVVLVGGETAVGAAVEEALIALGGTVDRVAGGSRYATAALLATRGYDGGDTVVLATGANYPDALAGAAYAARRDAPILLVGDALSDEAVAFLTAHAATLDTVMVLGGEAAVGADVVAAAEALIDEGPAGG